MENQTANSDIANLTTSINKQNLNSYFSSHYQTWFWVLHALISALTVVGNGLVICVILCKRSLLEETSPNGRSILSLAVADFCVGVFNAPVKFICVFWSKCGYLTWAIYSFFGNAFMNASVLNLCVLTCDRYIAIVHPYKHAGQAGITRGLSLLAWTISFALQIPDLLGHVGATREASVEFNSVYIISLNILPTLWMMYAYARILLVVRKHHLQIRKLERQISSNAVEALGRTSTKSGKPKSVAHGARSFKTVGVVVAIFLVCNSFYLYVMACFYLAKLCSCSLGLTSIMVLLRYLNSAVNVFVYAFMKNNFQRELKRAFHFDRMRINQDGDNQTGSEGSASRLKRINRFLLEKDKVTSTC
ncbi:5-hydroxytryptamine receptor 6 [Nematostella vectensis]|uniref:5-hydroxytryptamine receptor 6 n=1 Tax=Nematostella vectensis TaxID=45351 RepID=UPI00207704B3|nr:5-hydroxytryptamine receptor 6 [Nematostella vectensis]